MNDDPWPDFKAFEAALEEGAGTPENLVPVLEDFFSTVKWDDPRQLQAAHQILQEFYERNEIARETLEAYLGRQVMFQLAVEQNQGASAVPMFQAYFSIVRDQALREGLLSRAVRQTQGTPFAARYQGFFSQIASHREK